MRLLFLIPVLALGGCVEATVGSVVGGECRLASTPTYAVRGRTTYDQGWIDDTTEALVRGCKQARPKARPATLDIAAPKVPGTTKASAPAPAQLHWWQRFGK